MDLSASAVIALIVIAISVHAALRQLELIRVSNQSATFLSFMQLVQSEKIIDSMTFIYQGNLERLCDELGEAPTQEQMWSAAGPALPALFLYESVGTCVLHKLLDPQLAFGTFAPHEIWGKSWRFIRLYRKVAGRPNVLDKLEALAVMVRTYREPEWPRMPEEGTLSS